MGKGNGREKTPPPPPPALPEVNLWLQQACYACIVEWSLGAVLYEDELAAINACSGITPQAAQVQSNSATSVSWTSSVVVSAFCSTISLIALRVGTSQRTRHLY